MEELMSFLHAEALLGPWKVLELYSSIYIVQAYLGFGSFSEDKFKVLFVFLWDLDYGKFPLFGMVLPPLFDAAWVSLYFLL